MTVTHVGSTKKYSEGWQSIFSGKKPVAKKPAGKTTAKKKVGKKAKR